MLHGRNLGLSVLLFVELPYESVENPNNKGFHLFLGLLFDSLLHPLQGDYGSNQVSGGTRDGSSGGVGTSPGVLLES